MVLLLSAPRTLTLTDAGSSESAGGGLESYAERFEARGYDDIARICVLNTDGIQKLVQDVGMTNRAHANRLKQVRGGRGWAANGRAG
jgi:hypothetical protein